jgi:hypothetical protein
MKTKSAAPISGSWLGVSGEWFEEPGALALEVVIALTGQLQAPSL